MPVFQFERPAIERALSRLPESVLSESRTSIGHRLTGSSGCSRQFLFDGQPVRLVGISRARGIYPEGQYAKDGPEKTKPVAVFVPGTHWSPCVHQEFPHDCDAIVLVRQPMDDERTECPYDVSVSRVVEVIGIKDKERLDALNFQPLGSKEIFVVC